jgi:acetyltransferase-like isoleucine patch superfamily enzyme
MLVRLLDWLGRWRNQLRLRSYIRKGLKVGENVRFVGRPEIGGTPYLVEVGNNVTIADGVAFITHDGATNAFRHLPQYRGLQKFGRIIIRDDCFVGMRSIILPGVSIGPRALVAAGSVVTRTVPPNSVVGGSPARYICSFDEYVRKAAAECVRYPPELLADPDKFREVLLATLPVPGEGAAGAPDGDRPLPAFREPRPRSSGRRAKV